MNPVQRHLTGIEQDSIVIHYIYIVIHETVQRNVSWNRMGQWFSVNHLKKNVCLPESSKNWSSLVLYFGKFIGVWSLYRRKKKTCYMFGKRLSFFVCYINSEVSLYAVLGRSRWCTDGIKHYWHRWKHQKTRDFQLFEFELYDWPEKYFLRLL